MWMWVSLFFTTNRMPLHVLGPGKEVGRDESTRLLAGNTFVESVWSINGGWSLLPTAMIERKFASMLRCTTSFRNFMWISVVTWNRITWDWKYPRQTRGQCFLVGTTFAWTTESGITSTKYMLTKIMKWISLLIVSGYLIFTVLSSPIYITNW